MLTWDLGQALSTEAPALFNLADRLSECEGFRRLNDESTAEVARTKVVIGPADDPWEGGLDGKATIDDLENILLRANVHPAFDGSHDATEPDSSASCPDEGGTFEITIRRQIRRVELTTELGQQGPYLAFLDCVSEIVHALQQKSNDGEPPRLRQVRVAAAPGFADFSTESAQGVYMGCTLEADWGDRGAAGGGGAT